MARGPLVLNGCTETRKIIEDRSNQIIFGLCIIYGVYCVPDGCEECAFLYGTIEDEVYVCQPPGFEDPQFPDKVYKVEKALYCNIREFSNLE
ncbi:retrovirus-related pol polyprotein from transposon TNT 1-94 [Tanacetum coccineum]